MPQMTIVGARVICYVNGRPYGQVTSFEWTSGTPRKELYGIDSVSPFELVTTQTHAAGKLALFRTVGDGGLQGGGVAAQYQDLPNEKYFTIQLIERLTQTVLFEARQCSVDDEQWSIPAKGVMTGGMTFKALEWNNEVKPLDSGA